MVGIISKEAIIKKRSDDDQKVLEAPPLPGMTAESLARLAGSRVAVLGAAGTGAIAADYLSGAGITNLFLVDDRSFNAHNAEEVASANDVVVDGLSDWQDKLLASDACMATGKPLFHAGVDGFTWQHYAMIPGRSACLRCAFSRVGIEDLPQSRTTSAGFAPASGMAGAFQALEVLKHIAGLGTSQGQEFIRFDGLRRQFYTHPGLKPSLDCPDCKPRRTTAT